MLNRISVRGEVSNCKYHRSGHIYFTLKDEGGALSCVMFAGSRRGLAFPMKDGDRVVVRGAVDVYERDGRYQLYAREIALEGAGLLYERFLALKAELEEMGMLQAAHTCLCEEAGDRDGAHGGGGQGYPEYRSSPESFYSADSLSCTGAGRGREGEHRPGNRNPGCPGAGCHHRRKGRRFH